MVALGTRRQHASIDTQVQTQESWRLLIAPLPFAFLPGHFCCGYELLKGIPARSIRHDFLSAKSLAICHFYPDSFTLLGDNFCHSAFVVNFAPSFFQASY